nr:MAG TPA: hypothetical protein [Caudoviricetes sp.]DAP00202.1 MAG TPA: hypothetical protein [Caudoviricetes sp.]DAT15317.1 MAG TPA: hypothetical protein [Caudoviricetes sp.]
MAVHTEICISWVVLNSAIHCYILSLIRRYI